VVVKPVATVAKPVRQAKVRAVAAAVDPASLSPDELRVAISRLATRIAQENAGQDVCDRLEGELNALQAALDVTQADAIPTPRAR
jgi:hypothetical protein